MVCRNAKSFHQAHIPIGNRPRALTVREKEQEERTRVVCMSNVYVYVKGAITANALKIGEVDG
jgi:hypothetical protein